MSDEKVKYTEYEKQLLKTIAFKDEEVQELQEENNSLSVSIRKCGDDIDRLEAENAELKESIANTAQYQKGYESGLNQGVAEKKKLKKKLWYGQPWDLMSVLKKLTMATDILLHHYDYDADGWEEVQEAWKTAEQALKE